MAIALYHVGRTPGQTQYGLDTFTEHYKASEGAGDVLTDTTVPDTQMNAVHPDYPFMFVTARYCSETGQSSSALDVVYTGCMRDDGEGNPALPSQKATSGGEIASATTNTSSVIYPAVATNPASVQFYARTNTLSFISTDPDDSSEPADPATLTETDIVTWDLGFGVQPQCHDDIVTFLLTSAFVQGIIEPPAEIEPIVQGQFYLITKRKTRTLFPYNPAC